MHRLRTFAVLSSIALLLGGAAPAVAEGEPAAAASAAAVPDYDTAVAGNPFVDGWYADPDVAVYGDRYWVFPTTSRGYDEQTFMDAFSSTDLVHWKKHPGVLDIADIPWARRALWAPAPIERNGRYYLYFAANDIQGDDELGGIGVAVADRPEGPYRDALGKPLIAQFHNGAQPIDQDVFIDDDGQAYMYYGGWHHANVVKLNPDMTSLGTFDDGTTFKEITPENYTEGSLMFKRNGKYYMMWSEGGWTGPDYSVSYAVADSPTGPFERLGKVLQQDPAVARGSGHNSVLNIPGTDIWYIFYHRRPLSETDGNSRALAYDRMEFAEDGTIRPVTMRVRDNFDDDNAVGWKNHGGARWSAAGDAYTGAAGKGGASLQDTNFADLVYEGDVTLTHGTADAGFAFRATSPGSGPDGFTGYYAGLTPKGVVLRTAGEEARTLGRAPVDVGVGETHRLKVEAVGPSLKVYVDDMTTPKISVTDAAHASGAHGVRVGPRAAAGGAVAPAKRMASFDDLAVR
ncbi:glycoside hydrolase family 43 protein [Streptomyces sp. WMMC500]|uniref:glycoside hydrolase family 43 protein n=1 Tax=Streptomyces sp. WMMC500 TaxID=3015154 RepID=UPI00248BE434|nr:glycoside hydrolase family 43 protein [Streptomyces sp. WMMC500]WBB61832.1 glycoside hydrolase family 43 protein [Streptomyces sp. WMMC500]